MTVTISRVSWPSKRQATRPRSNGSRATPRCRTRSSPSTRSKRLRSGSNPCSRTSMCLRADPQHRLPGRSRGERRCSAAERRRAVRPHAPGGRVPLRRVGGQPARRRPRDRIPNSVRGWPMKSALALIELRRSSPVLKKPGVRRRTRQCRGVPMTRPEGRKGGWSGRRVGRGAIQPLLHGNRWFALAVSEPPQLDSRALWRWMRSVAYSRRARRRSSFFIRQIPARSRRSVPPKWDPPDPRTSSRTGQSVGSGGGGWLDNANGVAPRSDDRTAVKSHRAFRRGGP